MKTCKLLIGAALVLCFCGAAFGVPAVDVVQAPTGYFVPTDAQKGVSPYYRWYDEDWGWTHNAIGTAFTTAELSISAYDVDWDDPTDPEVDVISALDVGTGWVSLGSLTGEGSKWSYTTFTIGAALFDDIAAGLQVAIDIDTTHTTNYWAVTLAKSVLTLDGGEPPGPEPRIPEPASTTLVSIGVLSVLRLRKKLLG